ncbi:uncharacterized protein N7473_004381 [Penicillium subrubescens]|uniref:uncharacterized protein n=1 Tax=Penicillium subrubescens TaxID=1316194 RepID=UPI0025455C53|nr:uncharacterized protein N7473_004381 [Penicillium subrubescens]KAJ5900311.1 hypothetical protein N7473_004381 [Penicillium subrubescens]
MEKLHSSKINKPFRLGNEKSVRHILAKFSLWASARPKRSLRFTEQKSPCGNGKLLKMRQTASETAFVLSIISKKALHTFIKLPADMSLTLSLWTGFEAAGKVLKTLSQALFGP